MYLIDKLKMINSSIKNKSVEFILSNYLLTHLSSLEKLSLKKIAAETGLSRSSIIRFCQSAGYEGFTVFIDNLSVEKDELNNILGLFHQFDLEFYEKIRESFFKQCEESIKVSYHDFLGALKQGHRILFYGQSKYISCFYYLSSYLYMQKKEVINNMCWNIENQRDLFHQLNEDDLIIIIEPYMTWRAYKELLTITPEALHHLNMSSARKVYIGQEMNENIDISISLPYTYYENLYKDLLMQLDMKITMDLQREEK